MGGWLCYTVSWCCVSEAMATADENLMLAVVLVPASSCLVYLHGQVSKLLQVEVQV